MSATVWLEELHIVTVQVGGVIIECALVAFLLVQALQVLVWLCRLVAGGVDD